MDYKNILKENEKVLHISRLHIFVMSFPLVFSGLFGTIFTIGGSLIPDPEFRALCYIITAIFAIYPFVIALLIFNTRWIITNQRVIEQMGVIKKAQRDIDLKSIVQISFYQGKLGKWIKFGNVRIKWLSVDNKPSYNFFKYMRHPHEFIVALQEALKNITTA